MIRVTRPPLPETLAEDLKRRQESVRDGTAGDEPWKQFVAHEAEQNEQHEPTVRSELEHMFHHKCAYCERPGADEIDHFWPKSPHEKHNADRGSPTKMFVWENLLLTCNTCNSWSCKGAHMKWLPDDVPCLLDPTINRDDPLHYITVVTEDGDDWTTGEIRPIDDASGDRLTRAEYTIKRLKLNIRRDLVKARAQKLSDFLGWYKVLILLGPDFEAPTGLTIRQRLCEMMSAQSPYLAPIRQLLSRPPDGHRLYRELIQRLPELAPALTEWR